MCCTWSKVYANSHVQMHLERWQIPEICQVITQNRKIEPTVHANFLSSIFLKVEKITFVSSCWFMHASHALPRHKNYALWRETQADARRSPRMFINELFVLFCPFALFSFKHAVVSKNVSVSLSLAPLYQQNFFGIDQWFLLSDLTSSFILYSCSPIWDKHELLGIEGVPGLRIRSQFQLHSYPFRQTAAWASFGAFFVPWFSQHVVLWHRRRYPSLAVSRRARAQGREEGKARATKGRCALPTYLQIETEE